LQIAITESVTQPSGGVAVAQPEQRPSQVFRRVIPADGPLEVNARFGGAAQE